MDEYEVSEVIVDFGKICRLCLAPEENMVYDLIKLCEGANKLYKKIYGLMAIKIEEYDSFPKWICHDCLTQLERVEDFFDMCRKSDEILKNSLQEALQNAFSDDVDENLSATSNEMDDTNKTNDENDDNDDHDNDVNDNEELNDDNEPHDCKDCNLTFNNSKNLFVHRVSVHHDDLVTDAKQDLDNEVYQTWTCDTCGVSLETKDELRTHIKTLHLSSEPKQIDNKYEISCCNYCGINYNKNEFWKHFQNFHKLSEYRGESLSNLTEKIDCKICFRPFRKRTSLRNHICKSHNQNIDNYAKLFDMSIVYNCYKCDSLFIDEISYVNHYVTLHYDYPSDIQNNKVLKQKCMICECGFIYNSEFEISVHQLLDHNELDNCNDNRECCFCGEKCNDIQDLKIHFVSFHNFINSGLNFSCCFCNTSFLSVTEVKEHLVTNHGLNFPSHNPKSSEQRFCVKSCMFCERKFNSVDVLEKHLEICKFKTNHKCIKCDKVYNTGARLRRHINEFHSTYEPVQCPLCKKTFPRKMNLHNHYKRKHLNSTKIFVCSYCGKSLRGKVALKSHENRLHRNIRSFQCPHCPDSFTTSSVLKKHILRHDANRPMLNCEQCGKKFSTVSGLDRHKKLHSGVKSYICDIPNCGKSFYTKNEIKRHIKYHTRDFRHCCNVCDKKFVTPSDLKLHVTKHTGEKPYKCNVCGVQYARRENKIKHLKEVHNVKIKRTYGKPLKKNVDDPDYMETHELDTIVIDDDYYNTATSYTIEEPNIVYELNDNQTMRYFVNEYKH